MKNTEHAVEIANEVTLAALATVTTSKFERLANHISISRAYKEDGSEGKTRSTHCAYPSKLVAVIVPAGQYVMTFEKIEHYPNGKVSRITQEYITRAEARRLRDLFNEMDL